MYVSIDVCKYGWMDGRTDGWMLCCGMLCHVMSCHAMFCPVLSSHVVSFHVVYVCLYVRMSIFCV